MCTDTYTAGIIVKELGLLDKNLAKLKKTAKYKDADQGPLGGLQFGRSDNEPNDGEQAQYRRDGRLSADRKWR